MKQTYGLTLPRITGLDPAEPYFNDTDPLTRLETSDATFVDVIHTDDAPILGFPLSTFGGAVALVLLVMFRCYYYYFWGLIEIV